MIYLIEVTVTVTVTVTDTDIVTDTDTDRKTNIEFAVNIKRYSKRRQINTYINKKLYTYL